MACRVISISRSLAAGGEEVARLVAEGLGFRLVDHEIVTRAAEKAGVTPATVEKVERSPSLIDRILKYMGTTQVDPGFGAYVPPSASTSESYEGLIISVIREVAAAGNVVILAHGSSFPLAGMDGLLRVLVTGSREAREARLAAAGAGPATARKQIDESDEQRREYLQRFYDVRYESPAHYDLIINTDVITPATAAAIVTAAART